MVHKMQRLTMNNTNIIAKKEQSYPAILEDSEGGDEGEGTCSSFLTLWHYVCAFFFC